VLPKPKEFEALFLLRIFDHDSAIEFLTGDKMPRPVTTTLRSFMEVN